MDITLYDGSCVAHTTFLWGCHPGDEAYNWLILLIVLFDPFCSLLFGDSSDLPNHDDAYLNPLVYLGFRDPP
jgi:hypothetical protein